MVSDVILIKDAKALYDLINNLDFHYPDDIVKLQCIEAELEKRGYRMKIKHSLEFEQISE